MVDKYNKACTEILEILKYLPEQEYQKIPKEEIDFFEQNKDVNYMFKFNEELSFEEQSILPETQAIIVKLYKDYFYSKVLKSDLDKNLHTNNNKTLESNSNVEATLQIHRRKWYRILLRIFRGKQN